MLAVKIISSQQKTKNILTKNDDATHPETWKAHIDLK